MRNRIRKVIEWLLATKAEQNIPKIRGRLLAVLLLAIFLLGSLLTILNVITLAMNANPNALQFVISDIITLLIVFGLWVLNRSGRTSLAGSGLVLILSIIPPLAFLPKVVDRLLIIFVLPIIISGFVIHPVSVFAFFFLSVASYSFVFFTSDLGLVYNYIGVLILFMTTLFTWLSATLLENAIKTSEKNEKAQVEANKELEALKSSLEKQVDERTSELTQANKSSQRRASQFEAIAQVARATASVQNLKDVLSRITESISAQFGYYHIGIFLMDESNRFAVLAASNSSGGQTMLARGHKLEAGKVGIVGYVTGAGEARIALDTGKDAVFFNNPDLPRTRSEIALPLQSGKKTIGALDVQSTEPNAFGEEDIETLSVLADQVSLAIGNARLFEQTQRALAESELLNRQYLRQEWERLPKEQKLAGYRYNISGSAPLEAPIDIPDVNKVIEKGEILQQPGKNGKPARLAVPVQIRGETIGVLNIQSPEISDWQQEQLEIVKAVAERVALSAENARLFEETSRRAERERTVSQITTSIRSTTDPQVMLQTALDELKHVLGATEINIRPYNSTSSTSPDDGKQATTRSKVATKRVKK